MELNRNHYFMAGIVLLLLGIQFRLVDSYVLNEHSSRVLTSQAGGGSGLLRGKPVLAAAGGSTRKIVKPPEWAGWALMSIGSVLVLHSLAMKSPGAAP
ncbi:MAG: hypothetical protein ACREJM_14875 [Candidatus Saccharimonadales bacterium]